LTLVASRRQCERRRRFLLLRQQRARAFFRQFQQGQLATAVAARLFDRLYQVIDRRDRDFSRDDVTATLVACDIDDLASRDFFDIAPGN
jgi:hypothetical protein